MTYEINENNFSIFAKQLTKNLKEKNPSLKLSDVQEAISKTIGFNNLHCAKKQNFKNDGFIFLKPFKDPSSKMNIAFEKIEKNIENNGSYIYKDFTNMLAIISNETMNNIKLSEINPKKYSLIITDWFSEILQRAKKISSDSTIEMLFFSFFEDVNNDGNEDLWFFILKKINEENQFTNVDKCSLVNKIKKSLNQKFKMN